MTFSAFSLLVTYVTIFCACSRDFHQVQKYLKKDFEMLGKWFYGNYIDLNPGKYELMSFGKSLCKWGIYQL